ncbi:hypothetical protein ACJX0J_012337, partial [Zea mays]
IVGFKIDEDKVKNITCSIEPLSIGLHASWIIHPVIVADIGVHVMSTLYNACGYTSMPMWHDIVLALDLARVGMLICYSPDANISDVIFVILDTKTELINLVETLHGIYFYTTSLGLYILVLLYLKFITIGIRYSDCDSIIV